jgi:hypothetical protein
MTPTNGVGSGPANGSTPKNGARLNAISTPPDPSLKRFGPRREGRLRLAVLKALRNRDTVAEDAVRRFLRNWGPEVAPEAGDAPLPDFAVQCEAMLEAGPTVISSIMGLYPDHFVTRMKANGIKWFATATTVGVARNPLSASVRLDLASSTRGDM